MRLLKLANWLSAGDLEQYKQQLEKTKHKQQVLQNMESQLKKIQGELEQSQKDLAQTKAQLQIYQGFQIELGETQLKLQKADSEVQLYKKKLFEQQKQFNLTQSQFQQAQQALARTQNWTELIKTPVQIIDIQKTLPKKDFDTLWGFGIITPKVELITTTGAILTKGWVLGKKSLARTLRVMYQADVLLETEVNHFRPTVAERYPDISSANSCGFEFSISVVGIPETAKLNLEAILEDKTVVPLCDFILEPSKIELKDT